MKTLRRNTLYFGQYKYRARLFLPEASVLRTLDHDKIDKILDIRRSWGRRFVAKHPGSWSAGWAKNTIGDREVENLHSFCDFMLENKHSKKMVISGDAIYLYTNDTDLLDQVCALPYAGVNHYYAEQIELIGKPGSVMLNNPTHKHRSFLRNIRIDDAQRESLRSCLKAQGDIKISKSLQQALDNNRTVRLFDYYFIDHDDTGIITLLGMILPYVVRCTKPIEADK